MHCWQQVFLSTETLVSLQSQPVCPDWISILAIMTNSNCHQWLTIWSGCGHLPRGRDLLGWYRVGQRGIWTRRRYVLHHITILLHHSLPFMQVFSTIPVSALPVTASYYLLEKRHIMEQKKETININTQNFGGRETFLMVTTLLL